MARDNVTLENTQQSISSRDAKSVASVMVNGKWVNLSDTLEQANVKSDVGTVSKQVAEQQTVITSAVAQADSAVAYANDAIEKSRVNSQAIVDINSAVSDAVSDAAVARSDGLRAWNAAQSNADLIDLNYASASAAISGARTEAIAAADEAKASASAAQADIVAVRSDVAAVQADVTANKSDVAIAKSDIADTKTSLTSQAKSLSSYAAQASAAGKDITTLKSQAGQFEQDMADTKGDVSQLKVSASSASVALSDAAGNISSLQATAKSYSAALSDTNSNVASVTATASELETKYADAAGDINKLQTDAKGMTQTISNAQGDIAKLKIRADGFDTKFADTAGDINTIKVDAKGMKQTLTDAQGNISTLQATATGLKNTLTDAQGNISTLQSDVSGLKKTTSDHAGNIATLQADAKTLTSQMSSAQGDISTLKQTASGFSSKVSGMETSLANTNSKIDNLKISGRNYIQNSESITMTPNGTDNYDLVWDVYDNAFASNAYCHGNNKTRFSFYLTPSKALPTARTFRIYWRQEPWTSFGTITVPANTTDTQYYELAMTTPTNQPIAHRIFIRFMADSTSDVSYTITKSMLTIGDSFPDWQPAPEDTDSAIETTKTDLVQQITEAKNAAIKVSKDSINSEVSDVRTTITQVNNKVSGVESKVDSTKQDLQGQINSANTKIDNTNTKITQTANDINGKVDSAKQDLQGQISNVNTKVEQYKTGIEQNKKAIALKADQTTVDNLSSEVSQNTALLKVQADKIESKVSSSDLDAKGYATQTYTQTQIKQASDSWNANLTSVQNGLTDKYTNLHATVDGIQAQVFDKNGSSRITQLSNLIATKVSSSDFDNLSKSVDLQTLDSADINNMRTNGHYFVHNLANNPIGGWVYVDVTGNGTDRIRQDVYQDTGNQHCYRRLNGSQWTAWSQGATESEIVQLSDDINIRVKKGDVVSQINQEAGGNTLIQVSNGKGKLALNASSVVFSGSAFIPDAYISTLNADKLRFYDSSGNVATMSAGLQQYDDDKTKRSIVLQYSGGYEVHASNLLGSILAMHDNTIRLAVKANGADAGQSDQYSGFYAMSHYAQLSCYRSDGKAPGIYITDDGFTIKGDDSGNGTKYGDLYIVSPQIHVRGSNAVQMQAGNVHAWLSNDGILNLYKDNDGGSATATKLQVNGWAWVRGWVEAAGHSQHSALSTKTDIQSVDDDKMLEMVNNTDLTTFLYTSDVASGETHRHIGLIIDDVHDVAQYQTPQEFIAPNGVSRDDDNMIGALFGAVKALTRRIKTLESKVG